MIKKPTIESVIAGLLDVKEKACTKAFKGKCYKCHQQGHKSNDPNCPMKNKKIGGNLEKKVTFGQTTTSTSAMATNSVPTTQTIKTELKHSLIVSTNDECKMKIKFVLDSGASDHMVPHESILHDFQALDGEHPIQIAESGRSLLITGKGKLNIGTVTLTNVLVVPKLGFDLISVSALSKKGCKILFTQEEAQICIKNEWILRFKHEGNLYTLVHPCESGETIPVQLKTSLVSTYEKNSMMNLHKRMGHISRNLIEKCISNNSFRDLQITSKADYDCVSCITGKQSRDSFNGEVPKADSLLQIVHMDLGFLTVPGKEGHKMFLTCIDDFSGYIYLVLLHRKSQAYEAFKYYASMASN